MRRLFRVLSSPSRGLLVLGICWATLLTSMAGAQVVSGRVSNEAGAGVPHVRIIAFPVSDSSESATRVAISNADGNFRLRLTSPTQYVVRVRRIGFSPEPDQVIDAAQSGELKLALTLHALAIELPTVAVTAPGSAPRCLAMDDSLQDPQVRQWVDHALDAMRMRRLVERDFAFQVNVSTTRSPGHNEAVSIVYAHDPDRRTHGWMEDDPANLAGVARALTRNGVDILPTEVSLITPIFRSEYCFFNTLTRVEEAGWSVRFRNRENQSGDLATSGVITFAPDGLAIERVDFEFKVGKTVLAIAELGFSTLMIEGERYPIITSRSMSRAGTRGSPRARRMEESLAYSPFTRARGSSPLRPLRLPPGS
jgi:hypothetical protein